MPAGRRGRRGRLLGAAGTALVALAATAVPAQATDYGGHEVRGSIEQRYLAEGGPQGFLGLPLVDESVTPDGVGRFNHFAGGSVYWSPRTPAVEVHGAIRVRWEQMGWERSPLGYPVSNEDVTPDGTGRVNHFQAGKIYWTPSTGAHEVYGAILGLWVSLGYERSALGYPTSPEYAVPGGRRSDFQGGSIEWTPSRGAYVVGQAPAPGGVVRGTGTAVPRLDKPAGPALLRVRTTSPNSGYFSVYERNGGVQGDLLVSEVGPVDVVTPLDFAEFGPEPETTALQVTADTGTSWEASVVPLSSAGAFTKGQTIGEARGTVWRYVGPAGTARITRLTSSTSGYFSVTAYDADTHYSELLASAVGRYDGYVPIKPNQYLEIVADGPWAITVV